MDKRCIFLVESSMDQRLYHSLCIDIPETICAELPNLNTVSLESYEKFFFENKDVIRMKYYVADHFFAGILYLFGALFGDNGQGDADIMVDILDKVYISHSIEENICLLADHNPDVLLEYLSEIRQELLSREEDVAQTLLSKCNDLSAGLLSSQIITLPDKKTSDASVVSYVFNGIRETMREWLSENSSYTFSTKTSHSFVVGDIPLNPDVNEGGGDSTLLDFVFVISESITELVRKVAYEYDTLSKNDREDFVNLWNLLVATQYQGLLSSSYMQAVRSIIQR